MVRRRSLSASDLPSSSDEIRPIIVNVGKNAPVPKTANIELVTSYGIDGPNRYQVMGTLKTQTPLDWAKMPNETPEERALRVLEKVKLTVEEKKIVFVIGRVDEDWLMCRWGDDVGLYPEAWLEGVDDKVHVSFDNCSIEIVGQRGLFGRCNACKCIFSSAKRLNSHLLKYPRLNCKKRTVCPNCWHIQATVHPPFVCADNIASLDRTCPICDKEFLSSATLSQHLRKHRKKPLKCRRCKMPCFICGKIRTLIRSALRKKHNNDNKGRGKHIYVRHVFKTGKRCGLLKRCFPKKEELKDLEKRLSSLAVVLRNMEKAPDMRSSRPSAQKSYISASGSASSFDSDVPGKSSDDDYVPRSEQPAAQGRQRKKATSSKKHSRRRRANSSDHKDRLHQRQQVRAKKRRAREICEPGPSGTNKRKPNPTVDHPETNRESLRATLTDDGESFVAVVSLDGIVDRETRRATDQQNLGSPEQGRVVSEQKKQAEKEPECDTPRKQRRVAPMVLRRNEMATYKVQSKTLVEEPQTTGTDLTPPEDDYDRTEDRERGMSASSASSVAEQDAVEEDEEHAGTDQIPMDLSVSKIFSEFALGGFGSEEEPLIIEDRDWENLSPHHTTEPPVGKLGGKNSSSDTGPTDPPANEREESGSVKGLINETDPPANERGGKNASSDDEEGFFDNLETIPTDPPANERESGSVKESSIISIADDHAPEPPSDDEEGFLDNLETSPTDPPANERDRETVGSSDNEPLVGKRGGKNSSSNTAPTDPPANEREESSSVKESSIISIASADDNAPKNRKTSSSDDEPLVRKRGVKNSSSGTGPTDPPANEREESGSVKGLSDVVMDISSSINETDPPANERDRESVGSSNSSSDTGPPAPANERDGESSSQKSCEWTSVNEHTYNNLRTTNFERHQEEIKSNFYRRNSRCNIFSRVEQVQV